MKDNIFQLLEAGEKGEKKNSQELLDELLPVVYNELRHLASSFLRRENAISLQTTELVHEAYFKLTNQRKVDWENSGQFFAISAQAMRRILIDAARSRKTLKKGVEKVSLDDAPTVSIEINQDLIELDKALTELEQFDKQQSQIVELRYFTGLTLEETASVLKVSVSTVRREWTIAQAWLYQKING